MKIESVSEVTSHIIETDKDEFPIYRRNSVESWENLMGESWEPAYGHEEELEWLFQQHINSNR